MGFGKLQKPHISAKKLFTTTTKHFNSKVLFDENLTLLWFGSDFNQSIEKDVLPQNLTHLYFGSNFNRSIEKDVLPQKLTHLYFGINFNQRIEKGVLPSTLNHLEFGKFSSQVLIETGFF